MAPPSWAKNQEEPSEPGSAAPAVDEPDDGAPAAEEVGDEWATTNENRKSQVVAQFGEHVLIIAAAVESPQRREPSPFCLLARLT